MAEQPTGTVTLLFSDIEGSTALLQRLGAERYGEALDLHRRLLREAFERHRGYEVDCEGDSFFVAFASASEGVAAAAEAQQALAGAAWPDGQPIRVRIGIHTGEPHAAPPKYVGLDVHKAARVMAAGHGGQVLLSAATQQLVGEAEVVSLGEHRLKDLLQPEPLWQLVVEGLPTEFPVLKTLGNKPTNLPVQPSPMVGRRLEIGELTALLTQQDVRMATLTGPGGTGKTRLALQVAAELLEEFASGVFFVPLAPVREPGLVLLTVAQALAVREVPGEDLAETLARYLADKEMLLVLDNFEQVVDAAPAVVQLLACPRLKLLITSRQRLRVRAEHIYPVLPLPLVDATGDYGTLAANDAVSLFAACAEAAAGRFKLDVETAPVVAQICARLDGLPLAIELAAVRLVSLTPQALLARLDRRLPLLTGGSRDADDRQRTLLATIAWSYDLLTPPEQVLFARLSVFVGGCRLDAADAICSRDGEVASDSLDVVTSLTEKSLLRQGSDSDGQPRYWMLETIREYAREKLEESRELEAVSYEHMRIMLRLAQDGLDEQERSEGARRLEPERDNLRAAMGRALDARESKMSLVLATAYARVCTYRGPFSEGRSWLEAAIQAGGDEVTPESMNALLAAAALAGRQRDFESARKFGDASLRLATSMGDSIGVGRAQLALGVTDGLGGNHKSAETTLRKALAVFTRAGDERNVREALAQLGWVALARGDFVQARAAIEKGLALSRRAGDLRGIFYGVGNLGTVAAREGRLEEALQLLREALVIGQQQDVQSEAEQFVETAALATAQGVYEQAAILLGVADALRKGTEAAQDPVSRALQEETVSTLRRYLDDAQFATAHGLGQAMTLEEAVLYAVQSIDSMVSVIATARPDIGGTAV